MFRNYDIDLADMPIAVAPAAYRRSSSHVKILEQPKVSTDRDIDPVAYWAECLVRIRDDRDQKAFVEVFQYFGPRVKSFLMKSGADAAVAEDCVHDVMTTVWRKAHLFDPTRASVSTWVFTIARNRNIDIARRQRRPEPEDLSWGPQPEPEQTEVIGLQQETQRLGQVLASLPKEQRTMVEKAYFGDLSHSEIAAETGLPLGTIKSRIRLALERLRKGLT
jgi:RNA polymerase sigma factor (sigma-70 family)